MLRTIIYVHVNIILNFPYRELDTNAQGVLNKNNAQGENCINCCLVFRKFRERLTRYH